MNILNRRDFLAAATLSALAGTAMAQGAAAGRPLRIVTTLPPGGAADSTARFIAAKLSESGKRVAMVDSRPGGNGIIGVRAVLGAPANGETALMGGPSTMITNAAVISNLPYNPMTDFKPVAGLSRYDTAIVVAASSPVQSFADLVALAKRRKLNYGAGTATYQVAIELIKRAAGFDATAIPYKGTAPTLTDLIGNQIDFTPAEISGVLGLAREGRVRIIATCGTTRAAELPNVPTLVELGYKDIVVYGWLGIFMSAKVPDDQVREFSQALLAIMRTPEAIEFVRGQGGEVWASNQDEFRQFLTREMEMTRNVVKAAGIHVE
ncbi:MAG: tripartite tricarboxylate transporter substrate binding protein [Pseudomonadota bacterium]